MKLSEIAKALPLNLVRRHGASLVAHGTGRKEAAAILRQGAKASDGGNLGANGVYTTNSIQGANTFGTYTRHGQARSGKKRVGRVLMFKPSEAPLRSQAFFGQGTQEKLFRPEALGSPVHVQNVNRTTTSRALARERGVRPLPKTGYRQPSPTPVSQLSLKDLRARKQAVIARRTPPSGVDAWV